MWMGRKMKMRKEWNEKWKEKKNIINTKWNLCEMVR